MAKSSSFIADISYSEREQALRLRLRDAEYRYVEVPGEVYRAFTKAPSWGKYFNSEIRDGYDYE